MSTALWLAETLRENTKYSKAPYTVRVGSMGFNRMEPLFLTFLSPEPAYAPNKFGYYKVTQLQ